MIHWAWLLLAFFAGGSIGVIIASCMVAAGVADKDERTRLFVTKNNKRED